MHLTDTPRRGTSRERIPTTSKPVPAIDPHDARGGPGEGEGEAGGPLQGLVHDHQVVGAGSGIVSCLRSLKRHRYVDQAPIAAPTTPAMRMPPLVSTS